MHPDENVIHGYIDGDLETPQREGLERHLQACADCRALVDDLLALRGMAASLEPMEPPARAWSRIRQQIAGRAIDGSNGRAVPYWLAAAAVLVLGTVVGLRFWTAPDVAPSSSIAPGDANSQTAESIESELRQATGHYEKAIKGLEQIAEAGQGSLDKATAETLRTNLAVIDQAIDESRSAVLRQPASEPAGQSLLENLRTKVAVLQDTVALINEMRRGNAVGAARIVSGLKQKG